MQGEQLISADVVAWRQPRKAVGALRVARVLPVPLVGLAAAVAGLGALAPSASASELGAARAQVAELRARALVKAGQVHDWEARYQVYRGLAEHWQAEELVVRSELRSTGLRTAATRSLLQQEAVLAYAGALQDDDTLQPTPGDALKQIEKSAYQDVAVGDLTQTVAQFQAEQSQLASGLATAGRELRSELLALRRASAARSSALAEAASVQALLNRAEARAASLAVAARARVGPPVAVVQAVADQMKSPSAPPAEAAVTARPVIRHAEARGPGAGGNPATGTTRPPARTTSPPSTSQAVLAAATKLPPAVSTVVPHRATTVPTTLPTTTAWETTTTSAPPTTAAQTSSEPAPAGGVWLELRECESGDNYQEDTGNGYYGAYQFSLSTWASLGYPGQPDLEPYWVQDQAAQRLESLYGWGQWPACSAALGL